MSTYEFDRRNPSRLNPYTEAPISTGQEFALIKFLSDIDYRRTLKAAPSYITDRMIAAYQREIIEPPRLNTVPNQAFHLISAGIVVGSIEDIDSRDRGYDLVRDLNLMPEADIEELQHLTNRLHAAKAQFESVYDPEISKYTKEQLEEFLAHNGRSPVDPLTLAAKGVVLGVLERPTSRREILVRIHQDLAG